MEQRVNAIAGRVPITRISDVSRLELSPVPVFSATTPLARDLTTHMGKGISPSAARVSAMMEAIERVSAEGVHGATTMASRSQLLAQGRACVDPERFDLPPTTSYHPGLPIDWVEGWDLVSAREILVPVDLCVSPPRQGILDQVDTNGLASGATYGEAIRHALLEVIERDVTGQRLFVELFAADPSRHLRQTRIAREGLPGSCAELLSRIEIGRCRVIMEDLVSDLQTPVIACYIVDTGFPAADGPTTVTFGGWGCDTSAEHALNRALTEAHQSRIGAIQGARDSFNQVETNSRERPAPVDLSIHEDVSEEPLRATPASASLEEDVDCTVDRLRAAGIDQAVVVDMADPRFALPVVRVRVAGLSAFMADRQRIGWRCARHLLQS